MAVVLVECNKIHGHAEAGFLIRMDKQTKLKLLFSYFSDAFGYHVQSVGIKSTRKMVSRREV